MKRTFLTGATGRVAFCLSLFLLLSVQYFTSAQGRVSGSIRAGGGGLPVADAVVALDRDADPTVVDYLTESDVVGLFSISDVVAGVYTLRVSRPGFQPMEQLVTVVDGATSEARVSMTPLLEPSFDLSVDVSGVVSSLKLDRVPVTISRFRSASDTVPLATREGMTDQNGALEWMGAKIGFYRFDVNGGPQARPKWFSYTTATNNFDKRRLDRDSHVVVALEPEGAPLQIAVNGFNVALGQDSALTNVLVELAGVSFTDPNAVVIPSRTGETYRQGQVTFTNLPAIPWRVRAKRFGYEGAEIIVRPGADGALPKQVTVPLDLAETGIDIVLDSPFHSRELKNRNKDVAGRFHDGLFLVAEGLPDSHTAGITRFTEVTYDEERGESIARFRQLLPGTYRVFVPQGSGAISPYVYARDGRDTQLFVGFRGSDMIDAVLGEVTESRFAISPIPALVRGRLLVADERGLQGKPAYQPAAEDEIVFSEYKFAAMIKEESSLRVSSDSTGEFTLELSPGFYGVRLPDREGYFGSRAHITGSSDPTDTDRQGWPYVDPYLANDKPVWSFHHGLGMPFSSGEEYEVVLFVRKQALLVEGSLAADFSDRFRDLVLAWPNHTRRYLDLADGGEALLALGDGTGRVLKSPLESFAGENRAFYEFPMVPPGTHTLSFSHDRNMTPTETVEILPWEAPGMKPTRNPLDFSEKFPFDSLFIDTLSATIEGSELPSIRVESWNGFDYRNLGVIEVPTVMELVSRPGRFYVNDFRNSDFKWPNEPVNYWINVNSRWHEGTYRPGTALPQAIFAGGPDDTFTSTGPGFQGYDLTYRARSLSDATLGVDEVDVTTDSGDPIKILASANPGLPRGTVVVTGFKGAFSPNTVENEAGWVWEEFEGIDLVTGFDDVANRFKVEVGISMKRGMGLRGTVMQELASGAVAFPNAAVRILDRYGESVRQTVTDEAGKFRVSPSFDSPQTLFIEISMPGYEPFRRRVAALGQSSAAGDPPVVEVDDIVVKPLAKPSFVAESVRLNRKGLFLIGVKDAGPKDKFFGRDGVLSNLTMTWSASGKSEDRTVSLVGYDRADGSSGGVEQRILSDPVEAIWIIDPRAYDLNPLSDRPRVLTLPASDLSPAKQLEWLKSIQDGGLPNVFHQQINVAGTSDSDGLARAEGKIKLWNLPPGDFNPIFALVTQRGAVAFHDQFRWGAKDQLTGIFPPRWAADTLNLGGLASHSSKAIQSKSGDLQAEARVTIGPIFESNVTLTNQFLRYDYGIDVNWRDGASTPQAGLWSLAPGFMGLRFGGKASFGVHGDLGKSFLNSGGLYSVQFKIGDEDQGLFDDYQFGLFKAGTVANAALPETEISGAITVRWEETETDWRNPDAKYDLETLRKANGGLNLEVKQDIRPLVAWVAGNVLAPSSGKALSKIVKKLPENIKFYLSLEGGIGMGVESTTRTLAPYIIENGLSIGRGSTVTKPAVPGSAKDSKHVLRRHVMGGLESTNKFNLCFRFAAGGGVEAFGGLLGASLKVIGDGPAKDCPWRSVTVHPNLSAGWPFFDKAESEVRIEAEAYANAYIAQVKTKWKYELWSHYERGTDPFFDIVPLGKSSVALSPANAAPTVFQPDPNTLLGDFFDPGSCRLASGENAALVYTDITEGGLMSLEFIAHSGSSQWSAPMSIATAPGILDSAIIELPTGEWLVVWSEIESDAIGSLNPSSRIQYRVGNASASVWSPAAAISTLGSAACRLQLVLIQGQASLLVAHTDHGPFVDLKSFSRWDWNGTTWSGGDEFASDLALLQWQAIGDNAGVGNGLLVTVSPEGNVDARWIEPDSISAPERVMESGSSMIAVSRQAEEIFIVSDNDAGGIQLSDATESGGWSNPTELISGATPSDIELRVREDSKLMLGWVRNGAVSDVEVGSWDVVNGDWELIPRLVYQGEDRVSGLQLISEAGNSVQVLFKETGDSVSIRQFSVAISDAPVIETLEFSENGELGFVVQLSPGETYRLEGSADLVNWEALVEDQVNETPWRVTDSKNNTRDWQFYRVVRVNP